MTATSVSLKDAYNYGLLPFMIIYVPEMKVRGLPILCNDKKASQDSEILLLEPENPKESPKESPKKNEEKSILPISEIITGEVPTIGTRGDEDYEKSLNLLQKYQIR